MKEGKNVRSLKERWGEFRFGVVGRLFSSPPEAGGLKRSLYDLADKIWVHPITGRPTKFGVSTIERWYYDCVKSQGPVMQVLQRKTRRDVGQKRVLNAEMENFVRVEYNEHPSWSYKLHVDNLLSELKKRHAGAKMPSESTVRRWMKSCGLFKVKKVRGQNRKTALAARELAANREIRSFENEYVGGLWHLDFHHCSRQVLLKNGTWATPICLAVLDDNSRILCHAQWYLQETTESLVHGFSQAIQKRGLPRALLSDNGSAMVSAEFTQGLSRLGVVHETTLPYSPYQNGKQERFFRVLEGRLLAMLENYSKLSLSELNKATMAWMEIEYNRLVNEETTEAPLQRFLNNKNVLRLSPSSEELRLAFRREDFRQQRRTDGTVSVCGKRFELPARYRHLTKVRIRFAEWDLSLVHLIDIKSDAVLCALYPQDKTANASGERRVIKPATELKAAETKKSSKDEIAPLLKDIMEEYSATGLPPAYLPKDEEE